MHETKPIKKHTQTPLMSRNTVSNYLLYLSDIVLKGLSYAVNSVINASESTPKTMETQNRVHFSDADIEKYENRHHRRSQFNQAFL